MLERDSGTGFTTLRRDNGDAIVESTPKLFLGHIKYYNCRVVSPACTYCIRFAVNTAVGAPPTLSSLSEESKISASLLNK